MDSFGIAVLGVLNQEHHQECDNGRSSVDDQLPCVGKMKSGTGNKPDGNDKHSSSKRPGAAEYDCGTARENPERVTDDAKEISFALAFLSFVSLDFFHNRHLSFRARVLDCAH